MRYTHGELFLPVAVEDYVAHCQLMSRTEAREPVVVLDRGEVTLERLAAAGSAEPSHRLYLRLVGHPLSRWQTFRWRRRLLTLWAAVSTLVILAGVVLWFGWAVAAMAVTATLAVGLLVVNLIELERR